ncbi:uncharacterized protein SOCE26_037190 [Sorangium cellulosum]|uniref:site-specific DNA-methyltransferase (adenine-specific) n=1 Tax=Sorangium cellulosum TaxID=56 RepID=A0A2L0ESM2_SORCE|nr:BREX-2 system adenine-specific DNA-methyltransferase PglX [Sorangium cellulosum]AUX42289.1 uncharacterized protein SOCE26_037190 [Sorangium cellulosum]
MAAPKAKTPRKTKVVERNLTRELSTLLAKTLLPDLKERARPENVREALRQQWAQEKKQHRTADDFDDWIPRTLEQIGVAWILSCVFVRTLEDRGYLTHARIAGEGAADAEELFFRLFPSLSVRDYLLAVFRELSHTPGGDDVLGPRHNPAWRLAPGVEATRALLAFFRETDAGGELVWKFGGKETRFLGDLYQDVSEGVRERFALLQTPEFVEEFILDLTLEPAIKEYGLTEVRLIDPTCGSGHFLLGAFKRIFEARQRKAPGVSPKEHAGAALAQVYGVDLNPYAVAIARFRLVLEYVDAAGIDKIRDTPHLKTNLTVADALLHGEDATTRGLWEVSDNASDWGEDAFQLEDPKEARRILGQRYHVVVGNPPFGSPPNRALKDLYRSRYVSASGKYVLAAPCVELFFKLGGEGAHVGMINSSTFANHKFGMPLLEKVLPNFDITHIINTSGAYFPPPGFSVPTVIIIGIRRRPISSTFIVRQIGLDPGEYTDPKQGVVWQKILDNFNNSGFSDEYIEVEVVDQGNVHVYPWRLTGGVGAAYVEALEAIDNTMLSDCCSEAGPGAVAMSNADAIYIAHRDAFERAGIANWTRRHLTGETIRDFVCHGSEHIFWPYDSDLKPRDIVEHPRVVRWLWPYRHILESRATFRRGGTYKSDGRLWYGWHQLTHSRILVRHRILFPEILTEAHAILDDARTSASQSLTCFVPAKQLDDNTTRALVAYLNSSSFMAWVRRRCAPLSTARGDISKEKGKSERYRVPANMAARIPIPMDVIANGPVSFRIGTLFSALEDLGRQREHHSQALVDALKRNKTEIDTTLHQHTRQDQELRNKSVVIQEELDWTIYSTVCRTELPLAPLDVLMACAAPPEARPFTATLSTGSYDPVIHGDGDSANTLREIWLSRAHTISNNRLIADVETRAFKRSWLGQRGVFGHNKRTSAEVEIAGIRAAILAIIEAELSSTEAKLLPIRNVYNGLVERSHLKNLLDALAERLDANHEGDAQALADLARDDSVPYLAAYRYSESGLSKWTMWQSVWDMQRAEDSGIASGASSNVDALRYAANDFQNSTITRLRGELDVPKERFISYPGAEKDDDPSPLFGWAGWDHLEQATALAALYLERKQEDGWPADRLVPLLAGLLELVPWLKQWHNEPREDFGGERLGDYYDRYVEAEARALGKTLDDLRAWRPAGRRGRK